MTETTNTMNIEAKPQDIIIKKGRKRARLVIPLNNHQDVWIWNDTKAASPRQIFRGDLRDEQTENFLSEWEKA
jgi:hypothetical protein